MRNDYKIPISIGIRIVSSHNKNYKINKNQTIFKVKEIEFKKKL